uniref:Uncharacterized protein n=1 Tax=Tetranychus urticae TaxID=32264 RepID=T1KNL2_TETUR
MLRVELSLIIVLVGLMGFIIPIDCRHISTPEGSSRLTNTMGLAGLGSGGPMSASLQPSSEMKHQFLMIPSQYLLRSQVFDPERYQLLTNLRRERRKFPEVGSKGFEADIFDEGFGGFSTMR